MTSVRNTSEYHTLICYDARFDPKTIRVNMVWIRRKGPPDVSVCHLINFQLSTGIAMTDLKPNLYYKCILLIFLMLSHDTYIHNLYVYMENIF